MRSTERDIEFTISEGLSTFLSKLGDATGQFSRRAGRSASDNQGLMGVPLMLGLVYGFHALAMILT